jgi:hypothetical protein
MLAHREPGLTITGKNEKYSDIASRRVDVDTKYDNHVA